jgi:hypothetical protein
MLVTPGTQLCHRARAIEADRNCSTVTDSLPGYPIHSPDIADWQGEITTLIVPEFGLMVARRARACADRIARTGSLFAQIPDEFLQ